jgi:hypothetical protein
VISQIGGKVLVVGENEDTAYRAEFEIDFKIDNTKTKMDVNNNIYQIFFKK